MSDLYDSDKPHKTTSGELIMTTRSADADQHAHDQQEIQQEQERAVMPHLATNAFATSVDSTGAIGELEADEEMRILRKRALRKLDFRVVPALGLLWLANFVDRSNAGNARIAGLDRDLSLTGHQFSTALAVFYVTYIVSEIPSNLILKKMRPNIWLPLIVSCWGTVTTLTGLVQSFGGLVGVRAVLGLCEGGLLPGMVLYLSTLYPRHELQVRIALFYAGAALSGAFGGLLATGLTKMDGLGGLEGWRWIFIIEGIATVCIGLGASLVLPESVAKARFLSQAEQDACLAVLGHDTVATRARGERIAPSSLGAVAMGDARELEDEKNVPSAKEAEEARARAGTDKVDVAKQDEEFEWREVVRGLTDIQCWLTGWAYMCLCCSLYSFSLFLPTILKGIYPASDTARVQLLTVPPYIPASVLVIIIAFAADRLRWRGPFILMLLPISIVGYIMILVTDSNTVRYAAVFLIALGIYPCAPCILAILPNNTSGHYKRATTTALQLAIANCAGFVATFVYQPSDAPAYRTGHAIVLAFLVLGWILIAANVGYCAWENKARRAGRRADNVVKYQRLVTEGKTRAPIGDRSPDFLFTL